MPFLCHPFGIILLCHPFGKIFFRPYFEASLPFESILHLPIIPNKMKVTIYNDCNDYNAIIGDTKSALQ